MTSKNSFWASIRENSKRRMWVILVNLLFFVLGVPTFVAMSLSSVKSRYAYAYQELKPEAAGELLREALCQNVQAMLGLVEVPLMAVLVAGLAIMIGIQGFSYLYNRNKIDFYISMPVKRSRRFLVIWLCGILIYLLPSMLGFLLGIGIAAVNQAMTAALFFEICKNYMLLLLVFLGCYHLSMLAVMLTGNVMITCFGTAVLLLYEILVRGTLIEYQELFFWHYSYLNQTLSPSLSPLAIYMRYAALAYEGGGNFLTTIGSLLLLATVLLVLSYVAYWKRPAEAAGHAMAFSKTEGVIKLLLVVPVSLLGGALVANSISYDPKWKQGSLGFVVFGIAVILVITSCFIQVLYEFDIKAILHKKRHIFYAGVLTAIIFCAFYFDLTGYDSYIPKAEKVKSVMLNTPYDYGYYGGWEYLDQNGQVISRDDYMVKNMYLTDVGAINQLVKKSIEHIQSCESMKEVYNDQNDGESNWVSVDVFYRMNGRKTVSRNIYINLGEEETRKLLNRIMGSEEYIDTAYIRKAEGVKSYIQEEHPYCKVSATYGDSVFSDELSIQETVEFLENYEEDMKNLTFEQTYENVARGSLYVSIEKQKYNYYTTSGIEFKVYPDMEHTIAFLKQGGYYQDTFLTEEAVERIVVTNYHNTQNDWKELDVLSDQELQKQTVRASYDDPDKIQAICEKLYPSGWVYGQWSSPRKVDDNYRVSVYLKQESGYLTENEGYAEYVFLTGEIPDFVINDTKE